MPKQARPSAIQRDRTGSEGRPIHGAQRVIQAPCFLQVVGDRGPAEQPADDRERHTLEDVTDLTEPDDPASHCGSGSGRRTRPSTLGRALEVEAGRAERRFALLLFELSIICLWTLPRWCAATAQAGQGNAENPDWSDCAGTLRRRGLFGMSISHFRQRWELAVTDARNESGLRGFLDRGGFWRLMLVVLVYLAIYLGAGWVATKIAPMR